jgi:integrase
MGRKNLKGTISILNDRGRIRLRWRYQGERYSLNLHHQYSRSNLTEARKTTLQIEQDILRKRFDITLCKYSGRPEESSQQQKPQQEKKTIVQYFEEWTCVYKQMDCEKDTNYNSVRNMLKKWGRIDVGNIHLKLNAETFCGATYNRRLTMLKDFVKWLVKSGIWQYNPLEDIRPKRYKKAKQPKRKPFTEDEIRRILEAFRTDAYCSQYSPFKHSHYYPFIYFIFKTGVRNAESIGLRVGNVDVANKTIAIKEVMARSLGSTSSAQRIRKETKNGKERYLPMTSDLHFILHPLIEGRGKDALVFESPTGLDIDDHNFHRRIFKKLLKELKIEERVLYACRHTFGSRCIDSGMTPVMTAFLMGNNPETALRNYTHQLSIPTELPNV